MELKDILEKALIVDPDDSLSHVAALMAKDGRHEAVVYRDKLLGIVTADDISRRRVSNPKNVRISYYQKKVKPFSIDSSISDVINHILGSGLKAVPVKGKNRIYLVKKVDILKAIKEEVYAGKKAKDLMYFPYCVGPGDSLSTVISLMKDLSISRIPVLDEKNNLLGIVDNLYLLDAVLEKHRAMRGEKSGEKTREGNVRIESFIRKDYLKVTHGKPVKDIVKRIVKSKIPVVVVENKGKFMGMFTVKDIIKLMGRSMKTVYVRVSGLQEEDKFIKSVIDDMINNSLEKLLKVIPVNYLSINVEKHRESGRRTKYSVQGRLVTGKGKFYASDYEWDVTKAMKSFLEKIEKGVRKTLEKKRGY